MSSSIIPSRIHLSGNDSTRRDSSETVHLLPCHIKYSGPAPVSEFFHSTTAKPDGGDEREAYFRGRKLVGTSYSVPQDHIGLVFNSSATSNTQSVSSTPITKRQARGDDAQSEEVSEGDAEMEELTTWTAKSKFDKIVVYTNSGSLTSNEDHVSRGLNEWFDLANAMHGD